MDNPMLTVRDIEGRNPRRIIITGSSPLPKDLRIFSDEEKYLTIVACTSEQRDNYSDLDSVTVWEIEKSPNGQLSLMNFLIRAGKERVASLLVEGGSKLITSFLAHKLVDKIHIFTAPTILGSGLPTVTDIGISRLDRAIRIRDARHKQVGTDIWTVGYPEWR